MKSISHCQGKGSLNHNNRIFKPKNVDSGRTPDNVVFIKEPIAAAYENLFGAAVERYNAKQKRSDRKIKNGYYEYQFNHKISQNVVTSPDKRKSFYEDVVQIGTMNDIAVGSPDAETAKKCLTEYMENFQRRNPNFTFSMLYFIWTRQHPICTLTTFPWGITSAALIRRTA